MTLLTRRLNIENGQEAAFIQGHLSVPYTVRQRDALLLQLIVRTE